MILDIKTEASDPSALEERQVVISRPVCATQGNCLKEGKKENGVGKDDKIGAQ